MTIRNLIAVPLGMSFLAASLGGQSQEPATAARATTPEIKLSRPAFTPSWTLRWGASCAASFPTRLPRP